MTPDLTPDLVLDFLLALAMWAALAVFVFGALASELHMWRLACRRERLRRLLAARRRHG